MLKKEMPKQQNTRVILPYYRRSYLLNEDKPNVTENTQKEIESAYRKTLKNDGEPNLISNKKVFTKTFSEWMSVREK